MLIRRIEYKFSGEDNYTHDNEKIVKIKDKTSFIKSKLEQGFEILDNINSVTILRKVYENEKVIQYVIN